MNVSLTGSAATTLGISVIRFAGGQATVFDSNGNATPVQLPNSSVQAFSPVGLLGSNPGASIIQALVVPNLTTLANQEGATIVRSYSSPGGYQLPEYVAYPASGTSMEDLSVPATAAQAQNSTVTYYYSNGYWIADAVATYPALSGGSVSRTVYFQNVNWHDNASADAARASEGNTAQVPPEPSSGSANLLDEPPGISGSGSVTNLGGSQNVAFVHGLASGPSTWSRMTGWLNQDFLFGTEAVPSLSWTQSMASQASQLENDITSAGGTGYLLIGHSQGGLISRAAAQYWQSQQLNIASGVATIDTPHQGADLALSGAAGVAAGGGALGNLLFNYLGCGSAYDNWGCFLGAMMVSGGMAYLAEYAYSSAVPATTDLIPGSSFLDNLDNGAEGFKRAGIVSNTPWLFSISRVLDDAFFMSQGCYPETWCGERAAALYSTIFFASFTVVEIIAIMEGDWPLAIWAAGAQGIMLAINGFWNGVVSGEAANDGIVQSSSQYYPTDPGDTNPAGSTDEYVIDGADSHLGATHSDYVRDHLYSALVSTFGVPTQASCTFSVSPVQTPYDYQASSLGASSSFSVITQAGCKWSATVEGDAYWITITSGSSGTSNGTVSFSVAANPSTIPRSGTITVGNGTSSTTFTIGQYGQCTYSLSDYTVGIPSGGGTATVNVITQPECSWSAVPSAPWLTITSGATGTGSGSFTLSASANTGNSSLTATVAVMSQTVTVVLGNPSGNPGAGTGSITIAGTEQSKTVPPAEATGTFSISYRNPDFVYSGTVTMYVGNASPVQVSYTSTALYNLCSNMAGALAQTGLVTASCSGYTVNVTADTTGPSGDYPLSAQVTANEQPNGYPVNPSPLTVTASGMSGGSNGGPLYDTGSLTVTVNGHTYPAYSYGQYDTPASVATGIAGKIGTSCTGPVSAQVNGDTVYLTACQTGSGSNYPFSVSVTFNSSQFSSPSFSATPSGSTLTGGN